MGMERGSLCPIMDGVASWRRGEMGMERVVWILASHHGWSSIMAVG